MLQFVFRNQGKICVNIDFTDYWNDILLTHIHIIVRNTILYYTIPNRGVCSAVDVSLTYAETAPVHCREWQLEMMGGKCS